MILNLSDLKKLVTESLSRILKENMETEGGNAISQAQPIRGDLAGKVAQELIASIESGLKCTCRPLGSTGKKRADQTSGDIDLSVWLPWSEHEKIVNFIHRKYGNLEEFTSPGLGIYSIGFPYVDGSERKIVQVDFMFSKHPEFSSFMHHSPDFTKNESQFKGAFRTVLLRSLPKVLTLDQNKYKDDFYTADDFDGKFIGKPKKWWKYSLDMEDGLLILHRTSVGKTQMVKNDKRIPEDTEEVSLDINEIVKILMGDEATPSDCNSWESIVDFLFSDKYKYKSQENLNIIFNNFFQTKDVVKNPKIGVQMYNIVSEKMKENGFNFEAPMPVIPENNGI